MAKQTGSFNASLDEAVDEFTKEGFGDGSRLSLWLDRLRKSILADAPSLEVLHKRMKRSLQSFYTRATSKSRMARTNPSVSRYTIDMLKQQMRDELSRRIMASANLIKLNRERSIEQTLQRFSGWATSIPDGGSKNVDKREVKGHIKKAFRQLSYEERRVAIDQGHKLMSAIDSVVSENSGAIAAIWHSHWRQAGYDYRPDHKERDGKYYAVRNSWAVKEGLINKGMGYLDEMTAPAEEPFCRCYAEYVHALRDLPESMLTAKGKKLLEETRINRQRK